MGFYAVYETITIGGARVILLRCIGRLGREGRASIFLWGWRALLGAMTIIITLPSSSSLKEEGRGRGGGGREVYMCTKYVCTLLYFYVYMYMCVCLSVSVSVSVQVKSIEHAGWNTEA